MNKKYFLQLLILSVVPTISYYSLFFIRHYLLEKPNTGTGNLIPIMVISLIYGLRFSRKNWIGNWNYLKSLSSGFLIICFTILLVSTIQLSITSIGTDAASPLTTVLAHFLLYNLINIVVSIFLRKPISG